LQICQFLGKNDPITCLTIHKKDEKFIKDTGGKGMAGMASTCGGFGGGALDKEKHANPRNSKKILPRNRRECDILGDRWR